MRKILIAALLVLAGTAQAQGHGHGHGHGHRGFGGGQLAGAIIGGVIVGALIERSMQPSYQYQYQYQPQRQVYQYPPQVYYSPSYNDINYQQVQCPSGYQPTYVQNVYRQLVFVGCRNLE